MFGRRRDGSSHQRLRMECSASPRSVPVCAGHPSSTVAGYYHINSWRWNHAHLLHLEVICDAIYAHAVIQSKSLPTPGAKYAAPHVVARFP